MISDARVLRTDFVPRDVRHRDSEVDALTAVLDPLVDGEYADPALLFGPSGAGKTCIANYTVEQLRQANLDINSQYVNCWQNYSGYRALYRILEGLGKTVDVHRQSTPQDELLERLRQYDGPPCVVILDEADQLEEKEILYHLHSLPKFALVLIANDEREILAGVDDRVMSRFAGSERITFDRYSMLELIGILEDRAQWGLEHDAVSEAALEHIADVAAGDARAAISILRSAARRAKSNGYDQITPAVVDEAVPSAREEVHQKNVDSLTPHQRALYDCLELHGELPPAELYDRYTEMVDQPKTERTTREYLKKLVRYDLIAVDGQSRDRVYKPRE